MLLVILDAYSKWPEVYVMSSTTAGKTIAVLREVFSCFGLPKVFVSDNGPQFIVEEFKQFMATNGIRHICLSISPG